MVNKNDAQSVAVMDVVNSMILQLEGVISKLAIAADSGLSTYNLESEAKKLTKKIDTSIWMSGLSLYKSIGRSNKDYYPYKLSVDNYAKYADICKRSGETELSVYISDARIYVEINPDVFVCLDELSMVKIPTFKFKIEGNKLMAVSTEVYDKLPESAKKILIGKEE